MRCVVGNKIKEIDIKTLTEKIAGFSSVVIDLGCGDGRFVYKNASLCQDIFFIGVDPAEKQLVEYSKKAIKSKLNNVLFVVGSFEILPSEIMNLADKIYIHLPWGTLLEAIVKPIPQSLQKLSQLLKPNGEIEFIFGYVQELEPSETKRLELPEVDLDFINEEILPKFKGVGFECKEITSLSKEDLQKLETTWAKKLSFGKDRTMYKLVFTK